MTVWQPGMRCVCIGKFRRHVDGDETMPLKGSVYTVREVDPDSPIVCLRLVEIVNAPRDYGYGVIEASFEAAMFRPLSETRLDQFRAHLAPAPNTPVAA